MSKQPTDFSTLAIRLMRLEQRLESYCSLYEEEIKELRSTLCELREDLLDVIQTTEETSDADSRSSDGGTDVEDSDKQEPLLDLYRV